MLPVRRSAKAAPPRVKDSTLTAPSTMGITRPSWGPCSLVDSEQGRPGKQEGQWSKL